MARQLDRPTLAGLRVQLERRREQLDGGAGRVGWKIGLNAPPVQEKLGLTHSVIGYLTDATVLEPGASHSLAGTTGPKAEPEISIELRRDVGAGAETDEALAAIESLGPAIELVDFEAPPEDPEKAVAGNVFHRAVIFGPTRQDVALSGVEVVASIGGEERERGPAKVDLAETIILVADLLEASGERLEAGDRIIAGSLTKPLELSPGDALSCDFGPLGTIDVQLTD